VDLENYSTCSRCQALAFCATCSKEKTKKVKSHREICRSVRKVLKSRKKAKVAKKLRVPKQSEVAKEPMEQEVPMIQEVLPIDQGPEELLADQGREEEDEDELFVAISVLREGQVIEVEDYEFEGAQFR